MTAPPGAEHVAALKAFLTGDDVVFEGIGALLDEDGSWQAYGLLQAAALTVAARRRFPGGYAAGEVIRLVGRTRAALHDNDGQIYPRTAERVLRGVLSDPACVGGLDQDAVALATTALLKALIFEEGMSGPGLDGLLAESWDEARRAALSASS
jgi:hypothetical protein